MSIPINQLPQVQKEILMVLRRQTVSTDRLALSLKAEDVECPDINRALEMLIGLEFVSGEEEGEDVLWSLTNKGKVAAELLWFEKKYPDPSKILSSLGGG